MTAPLFYTWLSERPDGQPWHHKLSVDFWAEAALLGAARLRSNDPHRDNRRDRGTGNARVDLMGGASEVLLYRMLSRFEARVETWASAKINIPPTRAVEERAVTSAGLEYMRQHMYVDSGGQNVHGADFVGQRSHGMWAIDAKSFDFSPNKRLFAINDQKHGELAETQPDYFCLLCPPFAKCAFVAIVPYHAVSNWQTRILRPENPDPARILPINTFTREFAGGNTRTSCEQATDDYYQADEILSSAAAGGSGQERIAESAPPIGDLLKQDGASLDRYVRLLLRSEHRFAR